MLLLNVEVIKPISLLEVLNSKHPAIQFTVEVSVSVILCWQLSGKELFESSIFVISQVFVC